MRKIGLRQRNYLCDIYGALDLGSLPLDNLHYGVLLQERKTLDSTSYVYVCMVRKSVQLKNWSDWPVIFGCKKNCTAGYFSSKYVRVLTEDVGSFIFYRITSAFFIVLDCVLSPQPRVAAQLYLITAELHIANILRYTHCTSVCKYTK